MWVNERLKKVLTKKRITFEEVATKWLEEKRLSVKLSTFNTKI